MMSSTPRSFPDVSPELVLVDPELRRIALPLLPDPGSFAKAAQQKAGAAHDLSERSLPLVAQRSWVGTWSRRALVLAGAAGLFAAVAWPSAFGLRTPPRPWLVSVDSAESPASRAESRARRELIGRSVAARPAAASVRPTAGAAESPNAKRPNARPARKQARMPPAAVDKSRRTDTPQRKQLREQARAQQPKAVMAPRPAASPAPLRTTSQQGAALAWKAVKGASYYNLIVWRNGGRVLDLWPSANHARLPASWRYKGVRRKLVPGRYLWFVHPGFGPKIDARYGGPVQSGVLVVDRK